MMQQSKQINTLGEFSSEVQLMLASTNPCAATCKRDEIEKLLAQSIDWNVLLQLMVHHRVYPLVYKTLSSLENSVMPEQIATTLRQKCHNNTLHSLRITRTTVKVVKLLEENHIQSVVLKGPPLAQRLYGDVAYRPFKDIDILVWPEDLERANQVLVQQGFCMTQPEFTMTSSRLRSYMRKFHHFSYWHSGLKTEVELHWQLGHTGLELPLPKKTGIRRIKVSGHFIPVLADEVWLLFLVLHGASHGWFRLRWLCDIGEFMEQENIDWGKVELMACDFGIQSILHQAFILANQLLKIAVPTTIQPALAKDDKAWQLAKLAVEFFQNAHCESWDITRMCDPHLYCKQKNYDMQVRTSWQKKVQYVLNMFSPGEEDIKEFPLPDSLYLCYYAMRPFTWLWRRMR